MMEPWVNNGEGRREMGQVHILGQIPISVQKLSPVTEGLLLQFSSTKTYIF